MNRLIQAQYWGNNAPDIFLKIDLPVRYLLDTSYLLGSCIVAMLLYMLFYLWSYMVTGKKIRHLKEQFRNYISEAVIAESTEELAPIVSDAWLQKALRSRLGKKIFVGEMLKIRKGVSGQAVVNIQWLYGALHLQQHSMKRLSAIKWHRQAAAIQELAQMGDKDCITRIYGLTNHKNFYVRTEAQVALVKMTGFKGLRFLNTIAHPLTQWQQVCLLQQLSMQADAEPGQVAGWLQSGNDSVVELALKIVGAFKMYPLHEAAAACLQHPSEAVRDAALHALQETEQEAAEALLQPFTGDTLVLQPSNELS